MNNFSPLDFDLSPLIDFSPLVDFSPPVRSSLPSKPIIKNPRNASSNLGSQDLEIEDPTPDIWEMFRDFDQRFFNGVLVQRGVVVDWSPRMTQCAGLCRFSPGTQSCEIKLSKPLLQLRTRKDLVETLIHEMIHALLFVLRESDNRESHGPKFHENMFRINKETQLNISVYHSFHDEVNHYRTHVWRCKGACRNRSPFFGWVKRSMNRKPGPHDTWWSQHQQTCGGEFEKVSEPEGFNDKNKKATGKDENNKVTTKDIRSFFTPTKGPSNDSQAKPNSTNIVGFDDLHKTEVKDEYDDYGIPKSIVPFSGTGQMLGGAVTSNQPCGRSILLTKFGNTNNKSLSSTATSTTANTSSKPATSTSQNATSGFQPRSCLVLDESQSTVKAQKSPVNHFDDNSTDVISNKRPKFEETITLSDDEDDDDYSWLMDLTDEELKTISQPIVID